MSHDVTCNNIPVAAVIFAVIVTFILIAILFSNSYPPTARAWLFSVALLFSLIWFAILWILSKAGYHAFAWFLVLIPFGTALVWWLSLIIARATVPEHCINRPII